MLCTCTAFRLMQLRSPVKFIVHQTPTEIERGLGKKQGEPGRGVFQVVHPAVDTLTDNPTRNLTRTG